MPLYDYICSGCHYTKEYLESSDSNIKRQCVECNMFMDKQAAVSNFQFKGSGFYINDYKKKG
jgi:putative FmdB family regulatory protein